MPRRRRSRVRKIVGHASGLPTTPVPADLRAVLEQLAALRDRGELTYEAFLEAYPRARRALDDFDEEERLAHMDPVWAFGALVGCLREATRSDQPSDDRP